MSVYVRVNSKNRGTRRISKLVEYIFDKTKTCDEFCHTLGVGKETVCQDMMLIKYLYCKTGGRDVLHWVISHDEGVSNDVATSVACDVLQLLKGEYQAIAATHLNTCNRHTHFAINTVNVRTGMKFSESQKDMLAFRGKINLILEKHGLSQIGNMEDLDEAEWEEYEYQYNSFESLEENESEDSFSLCFADSNALWHGLAAVKDEGILIPGVFYERDIIKKHDFSIVQEDEGKEFQGYADIEDGRVLISGVLYEI